MKRFFCAVAIVLFSALLFVPAAPQTDEVAGIFRRDGRRPARAVIGAAGRGVGRLLPFRGRRAGRACG